MTNTLALEMSLTPQSPPDDTAGSRAAAAMRWMVRGMVVGIAAYLVFGAGEPWMLLNAPPSVYDVIAASAQCPGVHNPAPGCAGSPSWNSASFE